MNAVRFCVAVFLTAGASVASAEEPGYAQFSLTTVPKSTQVASLYTGLPPSSAVVPSARTTPLTGLYAAKVSDFATLPQAKSSVAGMTSLWVSPTESMQGSTGILQATTGSTAKPNSLSATFSPLDTDWRQQMRQPTIDWTKTNSILRNQPAVGVH